MTSIGNNAFYNTAWYNNQPDGLVYAGKVVYKYKGEMPKNTEIVIKDGTLGIADEAFHNCSGLTSITIPNSVTSIGNNAFDGCSGLTSITIGNSMTSIGDGAFRHCGRVLTSIIVENGNIKYDSRNNCNAIIETATNELILGCSTTVIPNSVTAIGDQAFSDCSGLTSVTIPNSVTSIGEYAFASCEKLTTVNAMMTNPPVIANNVFGDDDNIYQTAALYVPVGCKDVYSNTEGWKNFVNIQEKDFNATTTVKEDVNGDGKVNALDIQQVINVAAASE